MVYRIPFTLTIHTAGGMNDGIFQQSYLTIIGLEMPFVIETSFTQRHFHTSPK